MGCGCRIRFCNDKLHISIIAFERWAAVFHPLQLRRFATKSASKVVVTIVWVTSGVLLSICFIKNVAAFSEVIAIFIIGSDILISGGGGGGVKTKTNQISRFTSDFNSKSSVTKSRRVIVYIF